MKVGPATRLIFDSKKQREKIYRAARLKHWSGQRFILLAAEAKADAVLDEQRVEQAVIRDSQAVNQ